MQFHVHLLPSIAGLKVNQAHFFDTFTVTHPQATQVLQRAQSLGLNLRLVDAQTLGLAFGEALTKDDLVTLLQAFEVPQPAQTLERHLTQLNLNGPQSQKNTESAHLGALTRQSSFLTHPVFNSFHSETQMLRYMKALETKDLSLNYRYRAVFWFIFSMCFSVSTL